MVEIDPANPDYRPQTHRIRRFRHENITMRVEAGKKLVTWVMTDAGPHLEICQLGTVSSPTSKENSALFEDGILYVARYNSDGTGQWIPLS